MDRERISRVGLHRFEEVLHRRHRKITLLSEIKDCFDYFESHPPTVLQPHRHSLIHGNGITLRRYPDTDSFSIEINGEIKVLGKDKIDREVALDAVRRMRKISIPYARHKNPKRAR